MDQSVGMYQMAVQQNIAPAPSESCNAVDWLPKFAGFSWLAYGAHFSVVITMAPSPSNTGEVAMGEFFRQVLSTNWPQEDEEKKECASSVSWAPRGLSIGSLAAAAGKHIYLYEPKGLNFVEGGSQDFPEIPLRWEKTHVLEHSSNVLSFAWSESGDGLLSVGLEIVMWQKGGHCWNCLWRSQLEQAQSLGAASWSARGIAATAEGVGVTEKRVDDGDHLVKILWWEDGRELLEVDLAHPNELLMIQWRPMRGFSSSSQAFRPVLLTCCRDGVVRLWAEIGNLGFPEAGDSSLANVDPTTISNEVGNGSENQFKLAFFVSAVIDANSTLKGVLGQNIHITWPEGRGGGLRSSTSDKDGSSSLTNKDGEVAMNEWLVGIGPFGSITLWSVQSLDDLSPARGPLIQLWHQRSGLLPPASPHAQGSNVGGNEAQSGPEAVRVVVHRPHGTIWGPPSSLDLFEIWSPHVLRWSCIWPPVAAIGGPSSKNITSNLGAAGAIVAGGKNSAWGVSSELVVLGGHNGSIVQVAVHPIAAMRLVASLDDQGEILLWDANGSSFHPRSEITGCLNPLWRHSGRLAGHRVDCNGLFSSMAWAPVVLPRDDTVLLLGDSHGIDCFLLSKSVSVARGKSRSFSITHSLIYTLDWPLSHDKDGLQGIYTAPLPSIDTDRPDIKSCTAVGVGSNGLKLASWKLQIQLHKNREDRQHSAVDLQDSEVREEDSDAPSKNSVEVGGDTKHSQDAVPHNILEQQDSSVQHVLLSGCLLGLLNLGIREQVTSIAMATSEHLLAGHPGSLSDINEVFDIVTGCSDGALRLWKLSDGSSVNSLLSLEKPGGWHCVGLLRCYGGPVSKVALCSGTSKIASIGVETPEVIHIWGADTFIEERGFCLDGRLRLSSPAISLGWLDGGNGSSILGVLSQRDVQIFTECSDLVLQSDRDSSSGLSYRDLWTCLASSPAAGFSASTLSWEAQGSLIVTCGGHIILYSNCVLPLASSTSVSAKPDAGQALSSVTGQSSNVQRISAYEARLTQGKGTYIQSEGRAEEGQKSDLAKEFCSILEAAERIGCPLVDYHPTSLLSWVFGGSRQNARASVRHLASYLISSSTSGAQKSISKPGYQLSKPKVSRTPISRIFQEREQQEGGQLSHQGNSSASRTSFLDFSSALNSDYREEDQKLVTDPNLVLKHGGLEPFTKAEVQIISNVVRDSFKIPGLVADEKVQVLAVIDVISEMDGVDQPSQIDRLDLPGQRFWLAFRYSVLYAKWKSHGSDSSTLVMESKAMESRAMAWALQSEFKENLFGICLPDQSKMSWPAMRALGIGYWFTDGTELRNMMEKLARAQYLEKKDPKDCALLYLALDRKAVLASLFKLSRDQKDRPLAEFLFRDFKDEKHRVAALKNAYVLMGKHRHQLAAAFFILGGDINAAAVVCAKNLSDPQLALVISSLLEGVNGPIARDIILKYALPIARDSRDRWLASMLQWLLGKGIESVQELILNYDDQATPSSQMNGNLESSETPPVFPLDPNLGRYCGLLATKPRVRNSAHAAEASTMATIAARRSAVAMKRAGLLLQALECLQGGRSTNFSDSGSQLAHDSSTVMSTYLPSEFPLTDVSGRQVGSGWVSLDVVAGIWRATRLSLVLQCASQRFQDHPHWGGQIGSSWEVPIISGMLPKEAKNVSEIGSSSGHNGKGTTLDLSRNKMVVSNHLEGADNLFHDDLQTLRKKYSFKVDQVIAALSTFSRIHHRPYLLHRLTHGSWNFSNAPDRGFYLASQSAMSVAVAQYLEAFGTEAPRILAWIILSCGGAPIAQGGILEAAQVKDKAAFIEKFVPTKDGTPAGFSIEELVRFGGEIQLLAKAANHEKSSLGKERSMRAWTLLSFVFFVAAAWLGRQTKALFKLLAPTVIDPSTAPEVPQEEFDAVLWFRRLELEERTLYGQGAGKKPMEPVVFNMAGTVTVPADDAWRVLGVSLWNHLLIYVRKQLTGTVSEAAYIGFGRVSLSQAQNAMSSSFQGGTSQPNASMTFNTKGPSFLGFNLQTSALSSTWLDFKSKVRDSYQTLPSGPVASDGSGLREGGAILGKLPISDGNLSSTTDNDDIEVALVGALTSVVAGLRKQLAAHVEHSLNKSEADPLTVWLWGKPSPSTPAPAKKSTGSNALNFFNASSSNGPVATSSVPVYSQSQPNLFPTGIIGMEDKVSKDLWELLVVREKVCSALGLEGVSGPRRKLENANMSGWYFGREGKGPATKADSATIGTGVSINCGVPPKRIMWNAVKGVSSVYDPGATLRTRREEQKSQSRSQASGDNLHLSEEFSELSMFCMDMMERRPFPSSQKALPTLLQLRGRRSSFLYQSSRGQELLRSRSARTAKISPGCFSARFTYLMPKGTRIAEVMISKDSQNIASRIMEDIEAQ